MKIGAVAAFVVNLVVLALLAAALEKDPGTKAASWWLFAYAALVMSIMSWQFKLRARDTEKMNQLRRLLRKPQLN